MKTVKALVGDERASKSERCCGESGTFGVTPARHRDPGALPQGRGAAQGRGRAARDARATACGGQGQPEDPDLVPELPAGPAALQATTCTTACSRPTTSSSRWRDKHPRRRLDAGVRRARQRRRHRAGAGLDPWPWASACRANAAALAHFSGAAACFATLRRLSIAHEHDRPRAASPQPTSITVHQRRACSRSASTTAQTFRIPFELMRIYSPSAEVQGHGPGQEVLQTGKREVELVGARAGRQLRGAAALLRRPRHRHLLLGLPLLPRLAAGRAVAEVRGAPGQARRRPRRADGRRAPAVVVRPFALNAPAPMSETHFGFAAVDESAKAERVRGVFDSVAPKYDLMNDLMSLGLHRAWKAYTVAVANVRPGRQGARHRRRHRRPGARLRQAGRRQRPGRAHRHQRGDAARRAATACSTKAWSCRRVLCDAETLPFADGRFDLVSVAFGLRNMTHKDKALAEMARVLKPGGRLLVLEFSKVAAPLAKAYDWYSFKVLPRHRPAGSPATAQSYRYLAESIRMHPDQAELKAMMKSAGFGHVDVHNLTRRRRRAARGDQVLSRVWSAPLARRLVARPRPAAAARHAHLPQRRALGFGAGGFTTWLGVVAALLGAARARSRGLPAGAGAATAALVFMLVVAARSGAWRASARAMIERRKAAARTRAAIAACAAAPHPCRSRRRGRARRRRAAASCACRRPGTPATSRR